MPFLSPVNQRLAGPQADFGVRRIGHREDVAYHDDIQDDGGARDDRGEEDEVAGAIETVRRLRQRHGGERRRQENPDLERNSQVTPDAKEQEHDRRG